MKVPTAAHLRSVCFVNASAWRGLRLSWTWHLLSPAALLLAMRVGGQTFTTLHSFNDELDGTSYPQAGLVLSGSTLYGTTGDAVFRLNTDGSGFFVVHRFAGSEGVNPNSPLVLDTPKPSLAWRRAVAPETRELSFKPTRTAPGLRTSTLFRLLPEFLIRPISHRSTFTPTPMGLFRVAN